MKNLSIAKVRRYLLPVGTNVRATFLGKPLVVNGNAGTTVLPVAAPSLRVVVKQTANQMVSEYLDGPKKGERSYCDWTGVKAREENGGVILSKEVYAGRDEQNNDILEMTDFVRFDFV